MKKVGILGGGQLGRMLLQAAANYPVETWLMEAAPEAPAAHLCHYFVCGDITNYDEVYAFGKELDVLTIEIENVNVEALEQLEQEGVKVYPNPNALRVIQNKILQKEFYAANDIPGSAFVITQNQSDLHQYLDFLPAIHKLGMGGYDGRGVQLINAANDIPLGFDQPSVLEKKIDIAKEIAILVAVATSGETILYPAVEMIFDTDLNQLSHQLCPAALQQKILWKAEAIARRAVQGLRSPGLFAVEMFVDHNDQVLINEVAPRVHNSGHHTIEAHYCSQFDMLWRILLELPLGNTAAIMPSAMVNLIGSENESGLAHYHGLNETMKMENVFVHLYGKWETKPGRKMGHVTIISQDKLDLSHKVNIIRHQFFVKAK
jgi:5-(carboxyamino)imidazole ribonucleotide synthase